MKKTVLIGFLMMTSPIASSSALAAEPGPKDVVERFHDALKRGDKDTLKAITALDVQIYEAGGSEESYAEYASHHLGADIEFSMHTQRKTTETQTRQVGEVAWILSRGMTTGTFRKKAIKSHFAETMLLRRTKNQWRIVHIHWSSRKAKK